MPTGGAVSTGSQRGGSKQLESQDEEKKGGGRDGTGRQTKPQLLIKCATTGRQMAGCTCASLTQLQLSCQFDDSLPGVASRGGHSGRLHSACASPKAPKKTQLLPLRCRRLPGGEHARVACRVMPLSRPESALKNRKAPAAPPQSRWHGERREGSA